MSITIEPIKPLIGSILHVDKANLCDDNVIEKIRAALEDRGVLIFPQINVSQQEQREFTDRLGGARQKSIVKVPGFDAGAEDVYKITLDKKLNTEPGYVLGTFFWHIDGVMLDNVVPKAGVLSARQLAADGGATEFANLYAAYEKLPEEDKRQIEGLKAIHSIEAALRPAFGSTPKERAEHYLTMSPPMEQPLVWTHMDGRKSLLVGVHADGLVGWPGPHGRALLWRLNQWAAQPDFVYLHHWKVGDLLVWNNEGLMHRVVPYTDEGRVMHRTQVAGRERPGRPASRDALARMRELC
jgi:alpha-ketoglutarate-dependent taurine dioxygenase